MQAYRSSVHGRLIPVFGDMLIGDIAPIHIERWHASLPVGPRMKNKLLVELHGIFKRARKMYKLEPNPAAEARRAERETARCSRSVVGAIALEAPTPAVSFTAMSGVQDIVEDLVDLQEADRESRSPAVKRRLARVAERRVAERRGVPKAAAARMLGVSVNTLDKWIARHRIPVIRDERTGRDLVAIVPFARLLHQVRTLREAGKADGVLAAAIAALERNDPQYQAEFAELYGAGLDAVAEGRLKPVALPEGFGPED